MEHEAVTSSMRYGIMIIKMILNNDPKENGEL
jgi:hypothetical protein